MAVEWQLLDASNNVEDALVDVYLKDAYNRFAREAKAICDDEDGSLAAAYPHPTPVTLQVKRDIDPSFTTRLGGFVANPVRERSTTTLEILSHDFWLKKPSVYRDFSNVTISSTLNTLITELTPLTWDASRIDIYNDATVTREFKGESLADVLFELAAISGGGENFGATNDQLFFFEQGGTSSAPRDFTQGEYFDASFSEDGKKEVNDVTLYYNGNPAQNAVRVDDPESKRALQEEIGATRPVTIPLTKTYTEITNEEAAERKANAILGDRSTIQTGELETWEAFDVSPGDVARVVVPEQGIDGEYAVAQLEYWYQDDKTKAKLAENAEGITDTLVALSDEAGRLDARAANTDATIARIAELSLPVDVALELKAYKRTVASGYFGFGEIAGGLGEAGEGKLGDARSDPEEITL